MDLRNKRRAVLALEQLEDRWVPATTMFTGGTLLISQLIGNATVALTGNNSVAVTDNGNTGPTFTGVSNVFLDTGNGNHNVAVSSAASWAGGLTINAHNGSDSISLVTGAGTILGNITVLTGTGNDTVSIAGPTGGGALGGNVAVVSGSGNASVSVGGASATTFNGGVSITGAASVLTSVSVGGSAATTFNGAVSITGAGNAPVSVGGSAATTINGQLSITGAANVLTTATLTEVKGGTSIQNTGIGSSTVTVTGPSIFDKFLNINATGSDSISIGGADTINGNVSINLGNGNDTFVVVHANVIWNGSFALTIGGGSDAVTFFTNETFNGNISFNLGGGSDNLSFPGFDNVFGNLSVTDGNGNDSIDLTGTAITGNLNVNLGNGDDTVHIIRPLSGIFTLNAGNGNDSVRMGQTNDNGFWTVKFNFGSGSSTVELGVGASSTGSITGSVFSLNPGGNTFIQSSWTIVSPWSSNF